MMNDDDDMRVTVLKVMAVSIIVLGLRAWLG